MIMAAGMTAQTMTGRMIMGRSTMRLPRHSMRSLRTIHQTLRDVTASLLDEAEIQVLQAGALPPRLDDALSLVHDRPEEGIGVPLAVQRKDELALEGLDPQAIGYARFPLQAGAASPGP